MSGHCHYPLPDHPEFSIIGCPGYKEYRVENPKSMKRDGKWPQNLASSFFVHALVVALLSIYWQNVKIPRTYLYPTLTVIFILIFKATFCQLLYESVILLPPHGVQLETHHGFTGVRPLFSKRRFIPATSLQDVVINEGLKGWNVLYYLVAVRSSNANRTTLEVAYEELLPCHSILLEVFEGIHEFMLSD